MNKKTMKKTILKVAVPILVLSTSIGSYALVQNNLLPRTQTSVIEKPVNAIENTIDISQIRTIDGLKGVSNLFYYNGENEIAVGMNLDREKLLKDKSENEDLTSFYRKVYGDIYKVDINLMKLDPITHNQLQIHSLDADFGAGYSPNGKFIDVVEKDKHYIYDLESGERKQYSSEELYGNWTEDGNSVIQFGNIKQNNNVFKKFFVYDTKEKLIEEITLDEDVDWVDISSQFYSEDGKVIYFAGRVLDDEVLNTGLYKLDMTEGKIEDVISLPHLRKEKIKNPGTDLKEHPEEYINVGLQSRIYKYDFLSDGKIVFDGMIDSMPGLYVYDSKTKDIKMLLQYDGGLNFEIAPDESKIVYTIDQPIRVDDNTKEKKGENVKKEPVEVLENNTNVYVANIGDDGLKNITYVKKDTFACNFKWSNDSKRLIFFQPEDATLGQVIFK